jgi:hypothetical protein
MPMNKDQLAQEIVNAIDNFTGDKTNKLEIWKVICEKIIEHIKQNMDIKDIKIQAGISVQVNPATGSGSTTSIGLQDNSSRPTIE